MQQRHLNLETLLRAAVESVGYQYIGLESLADQYGSTLRIYIDSPQGITAEDCKKVSYQVGQVLSVEDPDGVYTLEVSSPGIERKLFTVEQCSAQKGKTIKLTTKLPIAERRNFKGVLHEVKGTELWLTLEDSKQEMVVNFADLDRAQVVAEW